MGPIVQASSKGSGQVTGRSWRKERIGPSSTTSRSPRRAVLVCTEHSSIVVMRVSTHQGLDHGKQLVAVDDAGAEMSRSASALTGSMEWQRSSFRIACR